MAIDTNNIKAYELALLKENYYGALGFTEGWLIYRVLYREAVDLVYDLITRDVNGNPLPTPAGQFINFDLLTDRQNRILFGSNRGKGATGFTSHLYDLFFGISPAPLKVWHRFPAGTPRGNLDLKAISPDRDQTFGFWDGFKSPFYNPSIRTRLMIPFYQDWELGYYLDAEQSEVCKMNILGSRYLIRTLDIKCEKDKKTIEDIAKGRLNCLYYTMGGIEPTISYQQTPQWKGTPVCLEELMSR